MLESNINIVSNIYIRREEDIRKDKRYTEKITGAALLSEINRRFGRGLCQRGHGKIFRKAQDRKVYRHPDRSTRCVYRCSLPE